MTTLIKNISLMNLMIRILNSIMITIPKILDLIMKKTIIYINVIVGAMTVIIQNLMKIQTNMIKNTMMITIGIPGKIVTTQEKMISTTEMMKIIQKIIIDILKTINILMIMTPIQKMMNITVRLN